MKKITSFAELEFDSVEPQVLGNCLFLTKEALVESIRELVEQSGIDMFRSYMSGESTFEDLRKWGNWKHHETFRLSEYWIDFNSENFFQDNKEIDFVYIIEKIGMDKKVTTLLVHRNVNIIEKTYKSADKNHASGFSTSFIIKENNEL